MILDDFDKKIMDILTSNARTPYSAIGKEIGLTAPAIAQRVQKMESAGIINGFTLSVDHSKLGIGIKAIVTIVLGFGKVKGFRKVLPEFEEIKAGYRVTGDDCMILHVHLENNAHLVRFLDRLTKYGSTKTNIVLEEF